MENSKVCAATAGGPWGVPRPSLLMLAPDHNIINKWQGDKTRVPFLRPCRSLPTGEEDEEEEEGDTYHSQ